MKLLMPAVVMCCAVSATAFGQSMAPLEIDRAIEAGQTGKEAQLLSRCVATAAFLDRLSLGPDLHPEGEHFHVTLTLTGGRIAALSAAARRLYKQFSPSEIPANLRTLAVYVDAAPHEPTPATTYIPAAIEHVVLKGKNGAVAQPDELKTERVEWPGTGGSKAPPNKAFAKFPISTARELPAGEFDIVLVTTAGERRCKVGARDRERLFGGR